MDVGSSPHTRGLPGTRTTHQSCMRIIPAHAGFTTSGPAGALSAADHPRTRGVYAHEPTPVGDEAGSSPHTRGLPPLPARVCGGPGIIPAHAGFTLPGVSYALSTSDHPRTRGVYSWAYAPAEPNWGSSPHTRGLRWRPAARTSRSRIIPAHAGFTGPSCSRAGWGTDHPRTRGVYGAAAGFRPGSGGSSPHTRGLPIPTEACIVMGGIIPAHAGFTSPMGGVHRRGRDHPRTRGVYPSSCTTSTVTGGSSPHTRGLR